jgi:ATP-dependent Lhr-like helicase
MSFDVFSEDNLRNDLLNSLNSGEMAKRKFRDIAHIAGLIFRGYPGKPVKSRHLQANSSLFFEVFKTYEPDNLLYQQAFEEVLEQQYEELRLRSTIKRIGRSEVIIKKLERPGPLAFPILVDRLRQSVTSETLADRVKRLELSFINKKDKKKK